MVEAWVADEVAMAFEEEHKRGQTVIFPIRIDNVILETKEPWAAKLRSRRIGDFGRWKLHDAYTESLNRILSDLKVRN
jgi:hypothetical protein